jgi:hypothetical protein
MPDGNPFKEGDIIALLTPAGTKPSKAVIRVDKLFPLLTRDELEELHRRLIFEELADPNTEPEVRREILSRMGVCPCCQRWLGHNNPPPDEATRRSRRCELGRSRSTFEASGSIAHPWLTRFSSSSPSSSPSRPHRPHRVRCRRSVRSALTGTPHRPACACRTWRRAATRSHEQARPARRLYGLRRQLLPRNRLRQRHAEVGQRYLPLSASCGGRK